MSSSTLPKTMLAWTHTSWGPPSQVLHLTSQIPIRYPKKPTEILVKVSHASLNPGGSIMLHFVPFFLRHSPAVPEMDFAGEIVAIGPQETSESGEQAETDSLLNHIEDRGLVLGAQVFGSVLIPEHVGGGHGALAEYVLVNSASLAKKPTDMRPEEAAGLGIAGTTALVLVELAKLKSGDRVLVNGASGGIGSMVVQLVKDIVGDSGRVVAVCSERNVGLVKGLGADEVVAYDTHAPVSLHLASEYCNSKFDAVIDAVGIQEIWEICASYLKPEAPFVTVGVAMDGYKFSGMFKSVWLMMIKNPFTPTWLGGVPRKYVAATGLVTKDRLLELEKLVESGKLKVVLDSVWDMVDAKKAYRILLGKRARGKIVIKVGES